MFRQSLRTILAIVLIGSGAVLTLGGIALAAMGVVPIELLTGVLLLASGVQFVRRKSSALHIFAVFFIVTCAAAFHEVGADGWSLLPRLDLACLILAIFFIPAARAGLAPDGIAAAWQALPRTGRIAAFCLAAIAMAWPLATLQPNTEMPRVGDRVSQAGGTTDWPVFGGDSNATKFSSLAQIDTGNVSKLKPIWDHVEPARVGSDGPNYRKDEATPLMVGDKVFVCTADNVVLALDAETGQLAWRFDPKVDARGVDAAICRGVAYAAAPASVECPKRLLMGTIDARLIALDAETGRPCAGFGKAGQVDLTVGLGKVTKGYYYVTSPPTIVNGIAVIGGLVRDNQETGEPSGVIRGYSVDNGRLLWAWDMARGKSPATPLADGEVYSRGTPNAWTIFSADAALGLVYIPLGNATPDFEGQTRQPGWEKYSSALVALDVATGQPRWSFQTVHHDLWDNDLSSQPVLASLPSAAGPVPVALVGTKRGQIFVLDRRNGRPVTPVAERRAPQTDVAGEWTSPTQPVSTGMPDLGGPPLTDTDMWGLSPFDRMFCRINLRRKRYDGELTPPSLRGSLIYPGVAGGIDWGGMSYDPQRQLLVVPTMHVAQTIKLIPRGGGNVDGNQPQRGTPYSAQLSQFMTRLGVPCQRPPYARLTGIDMVSRRIVWQRPVGTAEAIGPFGIPSMLPLTIGAPPLTGGGIATAGDLTFIGAYGDRRLRAIDNRTGRQIWSTRLPQGNQATPITYRAPHSHRQIVLMVSGNWADLGKSHNVPTHVVAYALEQ